MNKKIYLILIGLLLLLAAFLFSRYLLSPPAKNITIPTAVSPVSLPAGWSEVSTDISTVKKYEKKVDSGLKPQIVLITSEVTPAADFEPEKYIDKLIAGAKSTLPTLRLSDNSSGTFGNYVTRDLTGYYKNGKTKVDFKQKIFLKGEKVYTLTASYDKKNNLDSEIEAIFRAIASQFSSP